MNNSQMNNFSPSLHGSPSEVLAELENSARRLETPCGGGTLVWRTWGSGPPVVLLHGAQGSWSHWIRNIDALAKERTVWAVDLPGSGDSALPPDDTIESICSVLAGGLQRLIGNELPVDFVGFSFGVVVAAHLSCFYSGLTRRLVLVDTGGLDTPVGKVELTRVRGLEGESREEAHRHNLLALMLFHRKSIDRLALYLQELNGTRAPFNPAHLVLPDKLLTALRKTSTQLDVVWAEFDQPHPNPSAQEMVLRSIQPDLDFRVIADAGHWVMYERPDEFNRVIQELLDMPLRKTS